MAENNDAMMTFFEKLNAKMDKQEEINKQQTEVNNKILEKLEKL